MKAFEFRLERIADYRRQQADLARNELQKLTGLFDRLAEQRRNLEQCAADTRANTLRRSDLTGQDLMALSAYGEHVVRSVQEIERKKADLAKQIQNQRSVVMEAERNVKLLERLRDRKFEEWRAETERELDAIAADSHLARLASVRKAARLVTR